MVDFAKKKILVTGGEGFLGRHIVAELKAQGCENVTVPVGFDLRDQTDVNMVLHIFRPEIIIHTAAKVGGIALNQERPAEMFYDNLLMGANLIHGAFRTGVKKFVQIGSACEYPNNLKPPFVEHEIWDGYPEETNAAYGIAKRALLTMGQAYRSQYGFNVVHLLLANLYGPGDNFDLATSHVIPAMIRKFVEAVEQDKTFVDLWGTGRATREFLYVKDAARAITMAAERFGGSEPLNIGVGEDINIGDLARMVAEEVGYKGDVVFNLMGADGQLCRKLDTKKMKIVLDFHPQTVLRSGLAETIKWYKEHRA